MIKKELYERLFLVALVAIVLVNNDKLKKKTVWKWILIGYPNFEKGYKSWS